MEWDAGSIASRIATNGAVYHVQGASIVNATTIPVTFTETIACDAKTAACCIVTDGAINQR
jgi:hypothetical protein